MFMHGYKVKINNSIYGMGNTHTQEYLHISRYGELCAGMVLYAVLCTKIKFDSVYAVAGKFINFHCLLSVI